MSQNKPEPCPTCGLRFQCICSEVPKVVTAWHLALLTHPNELTRDSNTGKLLHQTLKNSSIHIWDRVNPPASLVDMITVGRYQPVVVYPSDESIALSSWIKQPVTPERPYLFILLDGTWQEARKMVNKSPWLKKLPFVHIEGDFRSEYTLRKNQSDGHLCTYEVGIKLLENKEKSEEKYLSDFFAFYLSVFKSDKSGHKLKVRDLN